MKHEKYIPYDPNKDYCGPEGQPIEKYIRPTILGIDVNIACWEHDEGYRLQEPRDKVDRRFWERMKSIILEATPIYSPRRYLALAIALRRYHIVKLLGKGAYNG